MREFLSKSIAGGLSAGVVLLWSPILFDDVDTVTSWFVRGVAWTVCFELLLVAFMPFERALWETARGERISSRMGSAGSRLHAGSRRKRIGRLSAVATAALVIPVAQLVMGLHEHAPASAEAGRVTPVKVVRVTKVVNVKRVVQRAPVSGQPVIQAEQAQAAAPPRATPPKPGRTVVGRAAPVQRQPAPEPEPEVRQESEQGCEGDACGSLSPAPAPSF
jgi:hypothetical protein